jgi:hypothetical protein
MSTGNPEENMLNNEYRGLSVNPIHLVLGSICALLIALVFSSAAGARTVNLYVYKGTYPSSSFDGSDAVGAESFRSPANVAVDEETGDVYVGAEGYVYHLNSEGVSQPFSALSPNTVMSQGTYGLGSLKVDNSGTATQGRIYAKEEYSNLSGYLPSGAAISSGFPIENLGDACGMEVAPDGGIWVASYGGGIHRYDTSGASSGEEIPTSSPCGFAIDAQENFYVPGYGGTTIKKYNRAGELLDEAWGGEGMGGENIAIDRSNGNVFVALYDHINEFDAAGELVGSFGRAEAGKSYPGLGSAEGIAVNSATHEVYVGDTYGSWKVDTFVQTGPLTIPNVTTEASSFTPTTAILKGAVDPDAANGGTEITGCRFEWGMTTEYEHVVNCETPALPLTEPATVETTITGLTPSKTYHFRLTANNTNGVPSNGGDVSFQASGPPEITNEAASEVFSDGARLNAQINPNGAETHYHFEWGTAPCSSNPCTSVPVSDTALREPVGTQTATYALTGLTPATTYYWRIVVKNANFPEVIGSDQQFKTFALTPPSVDTCANALVRKQTGAALLPDCRAFELVSAADTGGYDVESNLVPGQTPLAGYPGATTPPRALYTIHYGAIPGIGDPPNFGDDPYVATRGADGWTTSYVGVPITTAPDPDSFGSHLTGADAGLSTMAFGGPDICDPCLADGTTGIPIRLPSGELVQGMKGSLSVADPEPAGEVRKQFSDDGSNLVFGSEEKFEPTGNSGSVSIYERDLAGGDTQVVSTMPDGSTMSGEVAELDVSADGSRVLIGRRVGTDGQGNALYDLFMHVGNDPDSVLIADTGNGVLYDGMTEDGSRVYFSTDAPLAGDGDSSVDLFRSDVTPTSATTSRISTGTGGTGDTDACTPVEGWNDLGGGPDCGVLAIAGGGGVAADDGTVYFLSPELLDGPSNGTAGEPNLFVASPGGAPTFVATLEANDPIVAHAADDSVLRSTEDLQVTPDGKFATFGTRRPVTGYATHGYLAVYRYDAQGESVDCASCAPTGARAESDAVLPHNGGGITDDGRVFFTSADPLSLRDLNGGKTDVYEWKSGVGPKLVSTGTSEFDSALLSVSEDGTDAYFFTHDVLVAQDHNGNLVKVYDAREGGGFYVQLKEPPCRASDECHGPGTQAPPPPDIGTYKGVGGQLEATPPVRRKRCRGKRVRRHGSCVRRAKHSRRRHRRHHNPKRSRG